jgi:hypothetical protein
MTPVGHVAWLFGVVLILVAGCADGGEVGEGWQRFDAAGLRGAHPASWQPQDEQRRGWPQAALEVVGPTAGRPLGPVLVVYAEDVDVPTVDERAAIVASRMESELDAELVERTALRVPGAAEGLIMEFTFDAEAEDTSQQVPSRQFEVVLDAEDGRSFDMLLGGPVDVLDHSVVDGVLDSLHIR